MVFVTSPLLYQHNIFFFSFCIYNMYKRCLATTNITKRIIMKKTPTKEKVKWLFSKWNANNWIKWYKYDLHQILKVCEQSASSLWMSDRYHICDTVILLVMMSKQYQIIEPLAELRCSPLHSVIQPFIQFETDVLMIWAVYLLDLEAFGPHHLPHFL